MYDAPTGGSVKWAGEVHKLSVNGGLVNTMAGSDWSVVFDNGNPATGRISGDKLKAGTVPATAIAAQDGITSSQLATNAVDTTEIKDGAVTAAKLAPAP